MRIAEPCLAAALMQAKDRRASMQTSFERHPAWSDAVAPRVDQSMGALLFGPVMARMGSGRARSMRGARVRCAGRAAPALRAGWLWSPQ